MIWKKLRERKTNWTGADSQNELLETLYRGVIDKVLTSIRKGRGGLFSIIVDETADISNREQISICVRYVGADYVPV